MFSSMKMSVLQTRKVVLAVFGAVNLTQAVPGAMAIMLKSSQQDVDQLWYTYTCGIAEASVQTYTVESDEMHIFRSGFVNLRQPHTRVACAHREHTRYIEKIDEKHRDRRGPKMVFSGLEAKSHKSVAIIPIRVWSSSNRHEDAVHYIESSKISGVNWKQSYEQHIEGDRLVWGYVWNSPTFRRHST